MLARLGRWLAERALRRRIAALSEAERQRIVAASPFDAGWFQGEGFHVFRKDEPDMDKAYVTSLGEIDARTAEDWIIARWLEASDAGPASAGDGRAP